MPRFRVYSRRGFLAAAGGVAAWSVTIVPRRVLGGPGHLPPSERVRVAGIGAGGMGGGDIATHAKNGADIVALCDVDDQRAAGSFAAFPKASRYKDFRRMFDNESKRIDAVTVGTPDHIHAVATAAAIRAGKHVYCQKPLTHTLVECRTVTQAARAAGVMTQMGNQGHATEGARLTNEWIQAGVIGEIREVHSWCGGAPSFDNPYRRDRPGAKPPRGAAESRWTTTPHHIRTILLPMLSGGLQFLPRSKSLATLSTTWVPGDRHDVGQILPSATTDRYHRSKAEKARITPGLPT